MRPYCLLGGLKRIPEMDGNDLVMTSARAELGASGSRPLRRVLINDLELVASIGVYEHEHRYLQRVVISMVLEVHDRYDGASDDLRDVYDYDLAIAAVRETLDEGHINLIETAADRIALRCLEHALVETVTIRIEKPDVVTGCRSVGVEIQRGRAG